MNTTVNNNESLPMTLFGKIQKTALISLLTIAGVDYNKLQSAPKSERVVYPSLGVLMCLAAIWTGFGLTLKLQSGLDLHIIASILAFIFTTSFALLLEMVVVGTLKSGAKIWGNLGVRILLGINLMLLQVVPVLVMVFSPAIEVYKNEQVIQKTLQARETANKVQDIASLTKLNETAQERLMKAKEAKINPPENKTLNTLIEKLETKQNELDVIQKNLETAKNNVTFWKRKITELQADKELDSKQEIASATKSLKKHEGKALEASTLFEITQIERDDLQSKKDSLAKEYENFLNQELNEANTNFLAKDKAIKSAMVEIEHTTKTTKDLAQNAATSRFFNDVSSLFEIMYQNTSVLLTSLFIVFIALLIDLMPVLTKLQLAKGVYAKIINDEEEVTKAISDVKKSKIINDIEKKKIAFEKVQINIENERLELQSKQTEIQTKKLKVENDLQSLIRFAKEDQGKANAEIMKLKFINEIRFLTDKGNEITAKLENTNTQMLALKEVQESITQEDDTLEEEYFDLMLENNKTEKPIIIK